MKYIKLTKEDKKKREWLKEYRWLKMREQRLEEEIEKDRIKLEGLGTRLIDGMPRAKGNKKEWDAIIDEITEIDNQLMVLMLEIRKKRLEIYDAINSVKDGRLKVLLERRYLDCMKWEDICVCLNYSWNVVHAMHAKALEEIKIDKIKERTQVNTKSRYNDTMKWQE